MNAIPAHLELCWYSVLIVYLCWSPEKPHPAWPMVATSPASSTSSAKRAALDPRLIAALAAVFLIWSSTYLALGVAVEDMPPFAMATMRFLAAGTILYAIARRRGAARPTARDWLQAAPVGVLLFLGGNGFVAFAEQSISSGGAAVVCATMPLWVGVLGLVAGVRPRAREWASLALGFAGVLVLFGGPALAGDRAHVIALLISPIAWAFGSLLARRVALKDAMMAPALQMLTGGAMLAIGSVVRGEALPLHAGASAWLALAYLIVFGSIVGFTAYNWLLRNARPAVATSYAFVNPVLAVLIGAMFRGEPAGASTALALALIVAAVMLALNRTRSPSRSPDTRPR